MSNKEICYSIFFLCLVFNILTFKFLLQTDKKGNSNLDKYSQIIPSRIEMDPPPTLGAYTASSHSATVSLHRDLAPPRLGLGCQWPSLLGVSLPCHELHQFREKSGNKETMKMNASCWKHRQWHSKNDTLIKLYNCPEAAVCRGSAIS